VSARRQTCTLFLRARAALGLLRQPDQRRGEVHQREIVAPGLLIPRRDAAAALQVVEEALDAVADPVESFVVAALHRATAVRRDDRLHAARLHRLADVRRVVSFVADEGAALRVLDERVGDRGLVPLAGRQLEVERPPLRVDDRVDLGGESTT